MGAEMKHLRPHELDDEQRNLVDTIKLNGAYRYAPGELIHVGGKFICRDCSRVGSIGSGYCRICGEEE